MSPSDDSPTPDSAERFTSTEWYYARYRPRYGTDAIEYLVDRFGVDETSRVLDLGCGAGQIAIPLAEHAGEVVGMDPNEAMLREAREQAVAAGCENVEWVQGSDADLPADIGTVRLTTMGRSFHWMDQPRTLDHLFELTEPGGGVALVTDGEWLTHGVDDDWQAGVHALAGEYLDDLPERTGPIEEYDDPWDDLLAEHGFTDVETETVAYERKWDEDGVVGYVFSLSFCSPARFGDRKDAFEADLREYLQGLDGETFVQHGEVEVISGRR
ncbi:class I SAM-dependent methyltransferase [Haloarchaeobius sp. DYHT-AS-18]|uniref:class I SAM-dependent methyltransferase n=1 Tax=Haloarchaeobius sp. DYHT-AS-18 TaxID=3446117 RepID=UPI003EBDA0C9